MGVWIAKLSFVSPKMNVLCLKPVTGIDDFTKNIVCHSVQKFYDHGDYQTCDLKEILAQKVWFSGSITSYWKILKNLWWSKETILWLCGLISSEKFTIFAKNLLHALLFT